jgi:hypothetical protein
MYTNCYIQAYDELEHAEQDEQPFIVFKDKRKKKKYRRYVNYLPFNAENLDENSSSHDSSNEPSS